MKTRPILILAAVVLAICVGVFWFLQGDSVTPLAAPPVAVPEAARAEAPEPRPVQLPEAAAVAPVPKAAMAPKVEPRPLADWEVKIEQLLRSNIAETETAQIMINMLPTLPEEGQNEAAQHISNLILDKDYNRVLPLLKNTNLPESVLEVFVTDLMNRDDSVKLPALLEMAKLPNHPHHEEALTDLQIFLDGDFGNDWSKWTASMQDYLKKQAAENSAADSVPNPAK